MKQQRNLFIIAALSLSLLLAACSQPGSEARKPTPDGFVSVSLGLDNSSFSSQGANQGFQTLGSPYSADGAIAVTGVTVSVHDASNSLVRFNLAAGIYTASDSGSETSITLSKGGNAADLVLRAAGNPYTFVSLGEDAAAGNVIAYATQEEDVVTGSSISVKLESVLGEAVLTPRMPTKLAMPGEPLDLMLVVMANGNDDIHGDYLQVPLSDFTVAYTDLVGATAASSSNRGIRLNMAEDCTSVSVTATVSGRRAPSYDAADKAALNLPGSITCAAPDPDSEFPIFVDLTEPTVTLNEYNAATRFVEVTADDETALALVEVFDGPVLVATTDDDNSDASVATLFRIGVSNTFRANLQVQPLGALTAVATDSSGNEASDGAAFEFQPLEVWVAAPGQMGGQSLGASSTPTGSKANPFTSVQEGINAVADGGVVNVAAGTYREQLKISKTVSIVGADKGTTIINAPDTMTPVDAPANSSTHSIIDITGSGVNAAISNVTVSGPFPASAKCDQGIHGVRAGFGAHLELSGAVVTAIRNEQMTFCQAAVGVVVGRQAENSTATAHIKNVEFTDFAKGGIAADGAGSSVIVEGGSVTSEFATASNPNMSARNGIQISRGATGTVRGVEISKFRRDTDDSLAGGILLYASGHGVLIEGNTFTNNQAAILIGAATPGDDPGSLQIRNNSFSHTPHTDSTWYIYNNSATTADVSGGNRFEGLAPGVQTSLADLFMIEDLIHHASDEAGSGLVRVVPGHIYVTADSGSIQRGIDAAAPGDVINIEGAISYQEVIVVDKSFLTINGNGATVDGIMIKAAGVTIENLNVESSRENTAAVTVEGANASLANLSIQVDATRGTGVAVAASGLELDVVSITGSGSDDALLLGVNVLAGTASSSFEMLGGSIQDFFIGFHVGTSSSNKTTFSGVLIDGTTISNTPNKGMYIESLSDAVIRNMNIRNAGNTGGEPAAAQGQSQHGAGIDINLKYGNYQNIALESVTVTDSGHSTGHATGAAVTIKARDDASSYNTDPASLENLRIDYLVVATSENGERAHAALRLGEYGKVNAGPTGVVLSNSTLTGGVYSIMNYTKADVDALSGNSLTGVIHDQSVDANLGKVEVPPTSN